MIGSAGKMPAAFLESTVTSFGDYDTCLSIGNENKAKIITKYCMVDMFPIGKDFERYSAVRDKIYLRSIPVFVGTPLYMSFCVPAACNSEDIRTVTSAGMLSWI